MDEYIDKSKLYNVIVSKEEEYTKALLREKNYNTPTALQMQGLLNATTLIKHMVFDYPAADVVEVVRCNDCAIPHNRWTGCPQMNGTIMEPDDYCSYGKRKEGEE